MGMITQITSYITGSAVRLTLFPPDTAVNWRVCRNTTGVFADENSAGLIYSGDNQEVIDDTVDNGVIYHYQVFYFDGSAWDLSAPSVSITPNMAFTPAYNDPLLIVRDRLDKGLAGVLTANYFDVDAPVPVLLSSPSIETARLPMVTVHIAEDVVAEQFVAVNLDGDPDDLGWLSKATIQIMAWGLNGDERNALRWAIRIVLMANQDYFSDKGLIEIEVTQSDEEDYERYNAPMYLSQTLFTCQYHEALVTGPTPLTNLITLAANFE